jgi:tetrapyrrole methylase family protein/MazG family protein
MGAITVVGLGPGDPSQLTSEARKVLETASEIWLRTREHPAVAGLPDQAKLHSFDSYYEEGEDFAAVYSGIAEELTRLAKRAAGVVYAVPGHPLVGEATVKEVLARAEEEELEVGIVAGLSFIEPTLAALGIDALDGLQVADATEVAGRHHPPLNPDVPALLGQLHSQCVAGDVKLVLMNQYPDDHPVAVVNEAGTPGQRVEWLNLFELDRCGDVAQLTTLYVPPLEGVGAFEGLQDTVARLRAPGGCPWDREQTHETLRSSLLEEAYEVAAAIDSGDVAALQEELGDLLLQVLIHAQIATEEGEFQAASVVSGIDSKLKHRHPHVFGDLKVSGSEEVLRNWERSKREEKGERASVLDGVPVALPALQQADAYSRRAARVGFDWSDPAGVAEKVQEELKELERAQTAEEREQELGDLLFAIVNWGRWLNVDAESALREANARFAGRFRRLERKCREGGREPTQLSIEELEALWQEAKAALD